MGHLLLRTGVLCVLITSVSSGPVYVRSGEDITGCNMTCPQDAATVELYRHCGGKEKTLLEHNCRYKYIKPTDRRVRLDASSGCWKLTPTRKDDSCLYKIWCHCAPDYLMSSTDIRVLDPILISNITSNCSRLGQDIAVSVQYSGEESAVTWEVDGEPLPERYRLTDKNRKLIIPSVQREDAERTIRVRITNPVSEKTRDYRLINDTMFIRMLETEEKTMFILSSLSILLPVMGVCIVMTAVLVYVRRRRGKRLRSACCSSGACNGHTAEPTHPFQPGDVVVVKQLNRNRGHRFPFVPPTTVVAVTRTAFLTDQADTWIHATGVKKVPKRGESGDKNPEVDKKG